MAQCAKKGNDAVSKIVRRFPLVADGGPVSNPPKAMALYENEDLITNTHGTYHGKDYDDVTRDYNFADRTENDAEHTKTASEGKSYAELTRNEARRDIKKKRQAYLSDDVEKMPSKATFQQQLKAALPKAPAKPTSRLSHLIEKIHQEDYILAEIPVAYKKPDNSSVLKPKKNGYNFLRHSQIYNKEAQQNQREHKIAQKLNLTRFDNAN